MGHLLAYSGLVTKIRAMQSKLLSHRHYEEIAGLSSVPEVISYLSQLPAYQPYLTNIEISELHRGDVEKLLIQSLYGDYSRLYRFCGMQQKEFLQTYMKRYEVDLINYCFRIVFNHYAEPFDLNHKKEFFNKYSQISIERLITSRTIYELIDNLRGTEYHSTLQKVLDGGADTLFDYDLALDQYYFSAVWKTFKKTLSGEDLKTAVRDLGTKIDLLNLQWIYRAKQHYHMEPLDIYSLLIPIQYHVRLPKLRELVESSGVDEFIAVLSSTPYGKKYDFRQNHTLTLSKMYSDCLYHLYLADRRSNPYSIASLSTYLFLKEEELKKLTTALECIRYGLSSSETLDYIGGVIQ